MKKKTNIKKKTKEQGMLKKVGIKTVKKKKEERKKERKLEM